MAVEVEPTAAQVVARLDNEGRSPAILRHRTGRGEAMLIAAGEAALRGNGAFWSALRRLAVGEPTLTCSAAGRYRIVLTRVAGEHVLHVIDRAAQRASSKAADVTLSLDVARLGGVRSAALVGTKGPLKATLGEGRITFVLRPDPVASVVLR